MNSSTTPISTQSVPDTNGKLNLITTIVLIVIHVGAIAALFCFSWRNLAVAAFLYWLTIDLGISLGYHRLHTHRSYKVPRLLEYFFALCGASRWKAARFSGWPLTASTISCRTKKVTRIRPGTGLGGRTSAGFLQASQSTTTRA